MTNNGVEQKCGLHENLTLSGIEKKEDIYVLFETATDIVGDDDLHPAEWYPHWTFTHTDGVDWMVSLLDDCILCTQITGRASVELSRIPYSELESIGCDLFIDGSRVVGITLTLKNGVQIRLS